MKCNILFFSFGCKSRFQAHGDVFLRSVGPRLPWLLTSGYSHFIFSVTPSCAECNLLCVLVKGRSTRAWKHRTMQKHKYSCTELLGGCLCAATFASAFRWVCSYMHRKISVTGGSSPGPRLSAYPFPTSTLSKIIIFILGAPREIRFFILFSHFNLLSRVDWHPGFISFIAVPSTQPNMVYFSICPWPCRPLCHHYWAPALRHFKDAKRHLCGQLGVCRMKGQKPASLIKCNRQEKEILLKPVFICAVCCCFVCSGLWHAKIININSVVAHRVETGLSGGAESQQQADTSASMWYPARVNPSQKNICTTASGGREEQKASLRTPSQGLRLVSLNFKSLNLNKISSRGVNLRLFLPSFLLNLRQSFGGVIKLLKQVKLSC